MSTGAAIANNPSHPCLWCNSPLVFHEDTKRFRCSAGQNCPEFKLYGELRCPRCGGRPCLIPEVTIDTFVTLDELKKIATVVSKCNDCKKSVSETPFYRGIA